ANLLPSPRRARFTVSITRKRVLLHPGRRTRSGSKTGRVEIRHASVSHLPFPDQMFALATAVETHFYWPDLPPDMREVLRVLKPGGALVIVAEVYKGGKYDRRVQRFADMMQKMDFPYANLSVD